MEAGAGRTLGWSVTGTDSPVTSLMRKTRGAGPVCHKPVRTSPDTSMRMTAITCADITGAERYDCDDGMHRVEINACLG